MAKLLNPIDIGSLADPAYKSPQFQLYDEIVASGLTPPDNIIMDGELHRFSSNGNKKDLAGWYVAHDGQIPAAAFGCWRLGLMHTWRANIGRSLSMLEEMQFKQRMAEAKAKRDAEKEMKHETAAEKAHDILLHSTAASDQHPYLVKKGIKAHNARADGEGRLLIPICSDGHNKITSLQTISPDGEKRFLAGGAVAGGWYHIGSIYEAEHVCIAEGFATAASINEATGLPVAIAFNAGNLKSTAIAVRNIVGLKCAITICADLDNSETGEIKANEAAKEVGARVVVSPTVSDFNDAVSQGVDIASLINSKPTQDWLIHAGELMQTATTVKWLIKNWIPRDSLIMLHGPSGSGKSLVVMDMVCRVASHLNEWYGHKVRHGSVIYLAGEGYIGMNARLRAWSEHNNVPAKSINMWISKHGCNLNQQEGYQLARESIMAVDKKPSLIVVDTLHRFMNGDENSSQDAGEMIKACNELMQEFKCSVLVVHHTGVSEGAQSRARGSSAWKGAMESEISIKPKVEDCPIEIINMKSKDAALAPTKYVKIHAFQFDNWVDEDNEPVTGAIILPTERVEKDSKSVENDKNFFSKVVKQFGKVDDLGRPWVSDLDWSDAMVDENGVKTQVLRNKKAQMKKRMVEAGLIESVTNGYSANFGISFL